MVGKSWWWTWLKVNMSKEEYNENFNWVKGWIDRHFLIKFQILSSVNCNISISNSII